MNIARHHPRPIQIGQMMALCLLLILTGCQDTQILPKLANWTGLNKDEEDTLTASGTIEADEIRISSELGGRILRIEVEEGAAVEAGQALAQLDDTPLVTRLQEAKAALETAQAEQTVIEAGPRTHEIAAAEAALALAQAKRDGSESAWQHAQRAWQNPQQLDARIAEAETQIQLAEQAVAQAKAELAKEKLIRDQKRESSIEREAADWRVEAAQAKLAGAEATLHTAQTLLDGLEQIRAWPLALIAQANGAKGQYDIAQADVAIARARLEDLQNGPTRQEIVVARQAVRVAQTKVDVMRVQRAKMTLNSPIQGIVVEQILNAGELAAPAATILTVADLSQLSLTVYVPVNRLGEVHLDQEVQISVDSYPEQTFAGRVKRIGDQAEYTPRNVATQEERLNTFYAIEIEVDNRNGRLKSGMPADAAFK
jgi:multidrug resistance efflux pump